MGLEKAWETLQQLTVPGNENLARDARRLQFGVRITKFLYLMCLATVGQAGSDELAQLRALAGALEADTESMQGYDFGDDFQNALRGSWVANTYYSRFAPQKNVSAQDGVAL